MQIVHWLFKGSKNGSRSRKEQCKEEEEEEEQVKSRDIVVYEERDGQVEAKNTFTILLKREDSRASFYSTLQLKRLDDSLGCYWQQQSWQTTRNRGLQVVETRHEKAGAAAAGCKVLPIRGLAMLGVAGRDEGSDKEAQKRGRRALSRMKELMKWAAAAKSRKGGTKGWKVLYFRNKMALKDPLDDTSASSREISYRWDVGSCSTSSSTSSSSSSVSLPMSMPMPSGSDKMWSNNISRKCSTLQTADSIASSLGNPKSECNKAGQWITSDSDFVVLEL